MPYTQKQKQYLEAMGLVPWSLRGSSEPSVVENAGDCSVLLLFNHSSNQPLSQKENRLLLDMLGAIDLPDASVARRHAPVDTSADVSATIEPFLSEAVKVVLIAVHDEGAVVDDEESASRLLAAALSVPVWQLPHPGWIQQLGIFSKRYATTCRFL